MSIRNRPMASPTPKRTIVYVDGFNLFYGALKGTAFKWLDLLSLARELFPSDTIERVHFCTALIQGADRWKQERYLSALSTYPEITVHKGEMKSRHQDCRVKGCNYGGERRYRKWEEKFTDVQLGVLLVDDAHSARLERSVLISGDSDLVPAMAMIRANKFPIETNILVPDKNDKIRANKVRNLSKQVDKVSPLPRHLVSKHQLPDPVVNPRDGHEVKKPGGW